MPYKGLAVPETDEVKLKLLDLLLDITQANSVLLYHKIAYIIMCDQNLFASRKRK